MDQTLSLILPVFNVPNIDENLTIVNDELGKTGMPYEIIAVNDGSDAVTTTRLNNLALPQLKTYIYAQNHGKGFALRYGFQRSSGNLVCFMDADLQLHPQQIALFTNLMTLVDADVVIGSKRHPLSQVEYGPRRRLYSWGYQQLIRLLFNLNIADTQAGIKLFRRHVLEAVMPRLVVKTWAFDLELLVAAKHLGFHRILEAPVRLTWKPGESNINWKVIPKMLQDTIAIFYRKHILRFYDRVPVASTMEEIPSLTNHTDATRKFEPTAMDKESTRTLPSQEPQPMTSGVIFAADHQ